MLYIDKKFINLVSPRLDRFVWKSNNLANFRCPFCGDSTRNKFKARGYFFEKKGVFIYHCHNCSVGMNLGNFLKQQNPNLYRQYVTEKYLSKPLEVKTTLIDPVWDRYEQKINLPKISELTDKHPAHKYLTDRKIPRKFFDDLYYADDFKKFIDNLVPEHGKKLWENDPRLIIPFYDFEDKLVGITGRSLNPEDKQRYMIINIDPNFAKVYGLNKFDKNKKTYVTEGPFDSMFLENSIAAAGSNLAEVIPFVDKEKTIFIYDNEPMNKFIVSGMKNAIDRGLSVFFWPSDIKDKDINDYILSGHTQSEIMFLIDKNSKSGLSAKFQLSHWSKI